MITHPSNVLSNGTQEFTIAYANILQKGNEVVWRVCPVRATVVEPSRWQWLCEQFLAAER